jgi:hypothetical protein
MSDLWTPAAPLSASFGDVVLKLPLLLEDDSGNRGESNPEAVAVLNASQPNSSLKGRGNFQAAINQLNAFIYEVQAPRKKRPHHRPRREERAALGDLRPRTAQGRLTGPEALMSAMLTEKFPSSSP